MPMWHRLYTDAFKHKIAEKLYKCDVCLVLIEKMNLVPEI